MSASCMYVSFCMHSERDIHPRILSCSLPSSLAPCPLVFLEWMSSPSTVTSNLPLDSFVPTSVYTREPLSKAGSSMYIHIQTDRHITQRQVLSMSCHSPLIEHAHARSHSSSSSSRALFFLIFVLMCAPSSNDSCTSSFSLSECFSYPHAPQKTTSTTTASPPLILSLTHSLSLSLPLFLDQPRGSLARSSAFSLSRTTFYFAIHF